VGNTGTDNTESDSRQQSWSVKGLGRTPNFDYIFLLTHIHALASIEP
jgi:hypothetical protein